MIADELNVVPVQLALALSQQAIGFALSGCKSIKQIDESVNAATLRIPFSVMTRLDQIAKLATPKFLN